MDHLRTGNTVELSVNKELIEKTSFGKLVVWRKADELVQIIYKATQDFPKSEEYGLKSQMCRSAVSIPSNIAEGYMRGHGKEYARFLSIALGSTAELQTQIMIGLDLVKPGCAQLSAAFLLTNEVTAMLLTMIRKINVKPVSAGQQNLPPSPFPLPPSGDADA